MSLIFRVVFWILALVGVAFVVLVALVEFGIVTSEQGSGEFNRPESPESSAPESSSSEPPVPKEPKAEMHTVVVEGLRCRLDGSELSKCEDVCKMIVEKSSGPAMLDAAAGSHEVVEELRRCLEEGGVKVRQESY